MDTENLTESNTRVTSVYDAKQGLYLIDISRTTNHKFRIVTPNAESAKRVKQLFSRKDSTEKEHRAGGKYFVGPPCPSSLANREHNR